MVEHKVACPQCHSALKSAKPIPAGMKLKCPRCGTMFSAPHAAPNGPHNGALASAGGAALATAVQSPPAAAVPATAPP
ncbi:MAG TPA: MJ0042-type zinc finger domain-containing protein, partial [Gemmataceae bacterium]|nr:MJ0042-type zinc finger domain-containing protein [Gemmataceae bacterium]